jgi:nucleoside-diphosphate-sugar epimerase
MICILGGGFIALSLAEYMGERAFIVRRAQLDLTNYKFVKTFFEKNEQITAVILCATVGGSRLEPDPEDTVERNLRMFTNVQSNLNGRKMIWFSSGAAFMENSRYGYSKRIQERLSDNATCIRIYNCFGKKELPSRFIATCIREKSVIIPDDRYFDFFYIEHLYKVIDSVLILILN